MLNLGYAFCCPVEDCFVIFGEVFIEIFVFLDVSVSSNFNWAWISIDHIIHCGESQSVFNVCVCLVCICSKDPKRLVGVT